MRRINPKKVILDPSSLRPDRNGNGVDLAGWVNSQIDQGFINISGGEIHSFNTGLTTSANRYHTLTADANWKITGNQGIEFILNNLDAEIILNAPTGLIGLGDTNGEGNGTTLYVDDDNESVDIFSFLRIRATTLGVTQSEVKGLTVYNSTQASAGAQQMSPGIKWQGYGWKTDATAESRTVEFIADVLPVQGTANPTGTWQLKSSINGAAYTNNLTMTTTGTLTVRGDASTNGAVDIANVGANNALIRRNSATYISMGHGGNNGMLLGGNGSFGLYVDGITGVNIGIGVSGSSALGILNITGITQTSAETAGIINGIQTWNTTGAPAAIKVNITNTASDAASTLIDLQTASTSRFKVDVLGRVIVDNIIRTKGYTVATLPAGTTGDRAYVTDATAPLYNTALTGGGAVTVPVFYNGSAWVSA